MILIFRSSSVGITVLLSMQINLDFYTTTTTNGSFSPSGTGQYSTVRFGMPTVPLLDRRGVCRKVSIDNKARQ